MRIEPVFSYTDVYTDRYTQRQSVFHCFAHQLPNGFQLLLGHLEEQLVMYLQDHPRPVATLSKKPV